MATTKTSGTLKLDDFAGFVSGVLADWKVPGAAVAVVHDGAVVFSEGFGQRDREADLPVTPETVFAIASCSKAFTCASLAALVDAGKLDWDTPARDYLPGFRLFDPVASERITPRDLVCHRSGLPRHDKVWYGSSASREELIARLAHLEPTADFRALWQYQNMMYMVAGAVAGAIAGMSWEQWVTDALFTPLGMGSTSANVAGIEQAANAARPYRQDGDTLERIPYLNFDAVAPAGAINSSIADLTPWLLMQLNGGQHDGQQIISTAQIALMQTPQMTEARPSKWPEFTRAAYGLGWAVHEYRGETLIQHGGSINGFRSVIGFLPGHKTGVIALLNLADTDAGEVIARRVYDRALSLPDVDWNTRLLAEVARGKEVEAAGKERATTTRIADAPPSRTLAAYTGVFAQPGYGAVTIGQDDAGLTMTFNQYSGTLAHLHYDVFSASFKPFEPATLLAFGADVDGSISSLAIRIEPTGKDVSFRRQPPADLISPAYLNQFAGLYDWHDDTIAIAPSTHRSLTLTWAGAPPVDLEPLSPLVFRGGALAGFRVEFDAGDDGAITGATIVEPGAVIHATRTAG